MIDSIFKALGAGLGIWQSKEKRKYVDKLISLKRDWYEEHNKSDEDIDHAVLDNIRQEITTLVDTVSSAMGQGD